jgi:hypothetical protein
MPLPYSQMIALPRDGTFDNLAIDAVIVAELVLRSPLFKVEEVGEELERFVLGERL